MMKGTMSITCAECGKFFRVAPWELRIGKKYCSLKCRSAARGRWPEEELVILREHFPHASKKEMMALLPHRTYDRIQKNAKAMGLEKTWEAKHKSLSDRLVWNKGKGGYHVSPAKPDDARRYHVPWNKGKTKETDKRIKAVAKAREGGRNPVHKPGVKEKISKSLMGRYGGEKNPAYIDGRNSIPYTPEFRKVRDRIRAHDGYKCQLCGVPERECKRKLDVHHIDDDKSNNAMGNLVSLCMMCHLHTRYDREFYRMVLTSMMREKEKVSGPKR